MPPSEFVVKTVYWFFLYGCIGWGPHKSENCGQM